MFLPPSAKSWWKETFLLKINHLELWIYKQGLTSVSYIKPVTLLWDNHEATIPGPCNTILLFLHSSRSIKTSLATVIVSDWRPPLSPLSRAIFRHVWCLMLLLLLLLLPPGLPSLVRGIISNFNLNWAELDLDNEVRELLSASSVRR